MTPLSPSPLRRRAFAAAVIAICVALGAGVLRETIAHALVDRDPEAALAWGGGAVAVEAVSKAGLTDAVTADQIAAATALARRSLSAAPLAVSSLRDLAIAAQLDGDMQRATALMTEAGRRNLRDPAVHLWLFNEDLRAGRFKSAYLHGDLVLRRRPETAVNIYPTMLDAVSNPQATIALVDRLRQQPPWRAELIQVLSGGGSAQLDFAIKILSSLRSSAHPPTRTEMQYVTAGLVTEGQYARARQVWADFKGGSGVASLVENGDFEQPGSGSPFDWRLTASNGAAAEVELSGGENRGRALGVEYNTGEAPVLAEQLLVLKPGDYRLSGRAQIEQLSAEAGMSWSVSCVDDGVQLAMVVVDRIGPWASFAGDFSRPAAGCEAQWLRLKGRVGATFVPANAHFDDIKIDPKNGF